MTRSAAVVGGGTLISRVTGLARDVVLAWVLGASLSADAFFAAFRIPNFLRRIFAEGSLSTAFIPVFSDVLTNQGRAPAFRLACLILNWLAPILVLVSAAGIVFAPEVVSVLTPGWTGDTEKFNLTVTLTRVMFPYILLISVAALAMGVLNAQGHFAAPAFAPVLLNLAMIGSGVVASRFLPEPAIGIACGVLLGGLAQILLQMFPLRARGFRYGLRFSPSDPHLRQVGRLFVPSLVGSTVYQINMVVITVLASLLPQGSLSYLFYADRLMEFPLGVFAIAVGTVALPIMSRHAARGDLNGLREILGFAFRQVTLIMAPATVGLIVLREPLMSVLFQRGRFDPVATQMSAQALLYYCMGLWFVAQIRIVAPAFYALKDTVTPMVAATVSIAANLLLSLALMGPMAHGGLALAISIAAALQLVILLWRLGPRVGGIPRPLLTRALGKVLLSSMLMGIVCWLMIRWVDWLGDTNFAVRTAVLAASVAMGALCYGLLLFLLRVEDLRHLLRAFLERRGGGLRTDR